MPALTSVPVPIDQVSNVLFESHQRVAEHVVQSANHSATAAANAAYLAAASATSWTSHAAVLLACTAFIAIGLWITDRFCASLVGRSDTRRSRSRNQQRPQLAAPTTTGPAPRSVSRLSPYATRSVSVDGESFTESYATHPSQLQHEAQIGGVYQRRRRHIMPNAHQASMYHGQDVVGSFPVRLAILEQPGTDRPVYQHSFADRTGLDAYHVDIVHPGNTQQLLVSIYRKDFAGDDVQRQFIEYNPTVAL